LFVCLFVLRAVHSTIMSSIDDFNDLLSRIQLFARDSFSGIVGALAKVASGHPLDTMKGTSGRSCWSHLSVHRFIVSFVLSCAVRMQTRGDEFNSLALAISKTWSHEGVRGFYRGLSPTLPGVFAYNGALFAVYGQLEYAVIKRNVQQQKSDLLPTLAQVGLIGAGCGVVVGTIVSPVELLRCRLQASTLHPSVAAQPVAHKPTFFSGPISVVRQTLSASGQRGLFKGLSLTLAREIPANALYFMTYEAIMRRAGYREEKERVTAPAPLLLLAGGLAGVANWLFVFPIDTVKSRFQTDSLVAPRYSSILDCLKQTLAEGRQNGLLKFKGSSGAGLRGMIDIMFAGYSACLGRAFLANAVTFGAVELVHRWLPKQDPVK
jgi:solute carrier family 25 carnitine/acylcarnitine transporter 20/29